MFTIDYGIEILQRTPAALRAMLEGLSPAWTSATEGPDTWSAYNVVGHLIHGERTDWMARVGVILKDGGTFATFDRFAQFRESEGKSLGRLLDEFAAARHDSLQQLRALEQWRAQRRTCERPSWRDRGESRSTDRRHVRL